MLITTMTSAVAPWIPYTALHGMAVLAATGRIPPDGQGERAKFLAARITTARA